MGRRVLVAVTGFALVALLSGGCAYQSAITFPAASDVFMTSGDGDIQKPYTPIGELVYMKRGWVFPAPILGLFEIGTGDPEEILHNVIAPKVREMGGDGLINLYINWQPGHGGLLGWQATPGFIFVKGTVIKR